MRQIFNAFRWAIWLALLPIASVAAPYQSGAITCIQSQLASQGFYQGALDGVWGRQTRNGLQGFADENNVSPTPPLRKDKAIVWCRLIGETIPSLSAFWPRGRGVEFFIAPDVSEYQETKMRGEFLRSLRFFRTEFGLDHIDHVKVLVAGSKSQMTELVRTHYPKNVTTKRIRGLVDRVCDTNIPIGANATYGILSICYQPRLKEQDKWTPSDHIGARTLVTHELLHLLQFELAGTLEGVRSEAQAVNRRGPTWLVEGMAEHVEILPLGGTFVDRVLEKRLARIKSQTGRLRAYENLGTVRDRAGYELSQSAVTFLLQDVETSKLLDFWKKIGFGQSWKQAFEETFERSSDTFYADFSDAQGK